MVVAGTERSEVRADSFGPCTYEGKADRRSRRGGYQYVGSQVTHFLPISGFDRRWSDFGAKRATECEFTCAGERAHAHTRLARGGETSADGERPVTASIGVRGAGGVRDQGGRVGVIGTSGAM